MRSVYCLAVLILVTYPSPSRTSEVGFKFSGSVSVQLSAPYGQSMPPISTAVEGSFIYETSNAPTHDFAPCGDDCVGYRQQIVNGFSAKFGDIIVRADDYIVIVSNDVPGVVFSPVEDVFTVMFKSNVDPLLSDPLVVDGDDQPVGWFNLSITAPPNVFSGTSLPTTLNPSLFPVRTGLLSDTDDGGVDVLFSLGNLTEYDIIPGDYNLDETVDEADFGYWRSTFGSGKNIAADGNRNRAVDAADYTIWRDNLDPVEGSSFHEFASTVPEPTSVELLLTASILSLVWPGACSVRCERRSIK